MALNYLEWHDLMNVELIWLIYLIVYVPLVMAPARPHLIQGLFLWWMYLCFIATTCWLPACTAIVRGWPKQYIANIQYRHRLSSYSWSSYRTFTDHQQTNCTPTYTLTVIHPCSHHNDVHNMCIKGKAASSTWSCHKLYIVRASVYLWLTMW